MMEENIPRHLSPKSDTACYLSAPSSPVMEPGVPDNEPSCSFAKTNSEVHNIYFGDGCREKLLEEIKFYKRKYPKDFADVVREELMEEVNKRLQNINIDVSWIYTLGKLSMEKEAQTKPELNKPTSNELPGHSSESEDPIPGESSGSGSESEEPTSGESSGSGSESECSTSDESSGSDSESDDPTSEESSGSDSETEDSVSVGPSGSDSKARDTVPFESGDLPVAVRTVNESNSEESYYPDSELDNSGSGLESFDSESEDSEPSLRNISSSAQEPIESHCSIEEVLNFVCTESESPSRNRESAACSFIESDRSILEVANFVCGVSSSNVSESSSSRSEVLSKKLVDFVKSETSKSSVSVAPNSESSEDSESNKSSSSDLELESKYTEGAFSDKYSHCKRLCKGTFGFISRGYRNSDGLLVITKFIPKSRVVNDVMVFSEELQKKVPIEVSILKHIDHPNIVKVLDVFENDICYQLVMEKHGCGMDLFTFINRNQTRDDPLICYIFRQIVDALSFLHLHGIVHRDVKDENCLIDQNFHIKLIDFGSAAFISKGPFTRFFGTRQYCSPEVIRHEKYQGPEMEMFALGVTLYVLAFGDLPFDTKEDILKGELEFPKDASEGLVDLIIGLLEPVPDHRLTLPEVEINKWLNQPVRIWMYSFAAAINATPEEIYPPKFLPFTEFETFLAKKGLSDMKALAVYAYEYDALV